MSRSPLTPSLRHSRAGSSFGSLLHTSCRDPAHHPPTTLLLSSSTPPGGDPAPLLLHPTRRRPCSPPPPHHPPATLLPSSSTPPAGDPAPLLLHPTGGRKEWQPARSVSRRRVGTTVTGRDLEETRLHKRPTLEEMRREIRHRVDEGEMMEKPGCRPWRRWRSTCFHGRRWRSLGAFHGGQLGCSHAVWLELSCILLPYATKVSRAEVSQAARLPTRAPRVWWPPAMVVGVLAEHAHHLFD